MTSARRQHDYRNVSIWIVIGGALLFLTAASLL